MYGFFFFKKSKSFLKLWFISFFQFWKKGPWGRNQLLMVVKTECCLGSKLSAPTQSQCLCECTQFWPLVHSILTPGSTLFWPQAALYFDTQGLFSKLKKAINRIFKRDLDFLKKAIYFIVFLRFYGKNLFFNLGIPLNGNLFYSHRRGAPLGVLHIPS